MAGVWIYRALRRIKRCLKRDGERQRERYDAIVAKLDLLLERQEHMVSRLDDEFEGLATTWIQIKDEIVKGLAKVEAALAAVDLSGVEAQAQGLLADAQATLAEVQASFAKLPDLPVPPEPEE